MYLDYLHRLLKDKLILKKSPLNSKIRFLKSSLTNEICTFSAPTTTPTTPSCEDEWPQKKCKKCNAKKCKKNKNCKKKCKNTCNLCEDGGTSSSEVKD